jgi:type IV secretory pathway ATPase VirB11/archaellum biosynthesis ATPase
VHVLNDPWPWWGTLHGRPLTLADLIERGTLTREMVAVIAWTIAHGASVFVAAGPQGAGKSTVANAILELLPENAQVYVTSGPRDRLELPPSEAPTYLLINELSAHMSVYLSGGAVRRAFALLQSGVRMLGTLHADTATEAAAVLCTEAELPAAELHTAFVFVVIAASWRGQDIVRRVVELGFLSPRGELSPLTARPARANPSLDPAGLDSPTLDPSGLRTLAAWSGVATTAIASDLRRRAALWA